MPMRELSLGQRMRCELAAVLLHNPSVLLLDEPTIGLDIEIKQKIRAFLKKLNACSRTTIMIASHDLHDVEGLADRVVVIDKGRLVFDGSLESLRREYSPYFKRVLLRFQDENNLAHARNYLHMHFASTLWFHQRYIVERQLDVVLVRPINPYFQVLAEGLGSIQEIFSCALGALLMAMASTMLSLDWTLDKILGLVLEVFFGVLILGGLFTLLAALSFWVVGTKSFASPLMALMDFAQYPMEIYNRYIQFILTFVVPLGFIAFYPSAKVLRADYACYLV
ncbi:MAG: ABC-2 family transporter protein [Candidatus Bipolaricaulota bacterium]|nr:ABC-2 family transporter protein [Candidatus Bipolaricaulota bacterium]